MTRLDIMVRRLAIAAVALILLSLAGGDGMGTSMSPLQRTIMGKNNTAPTAYWPLESGFGSALSGGDPFHAVGSGATWPGSPVADGSAGGTDFSEGGSATADVRGVTAGTAASWELEAVVGLDTLFTSDPGNDIKIIVAVQTGLTSGATGFGLAAFYSGGESHWGWYSEIDGAPSPNSPLNDFTEIDVSTTRHLRVQLVQDENIAGYIGMRFYVDGTLRQTVNTPYTLYQPRTVRLNPRIFGYVPANISSLSHVAVWSPKRSTAETYLAAAGHAGETTTDRFARLCEEAGVAYDVSGTSAQQMGPQATAELMPLLRDSEAVDGGVIVERRSGEIGLDSLDSRINLATSLTLDYDASSIDDIAPTDDDLVSGNDWTITRSGGGSARVEQTTGPMGTDPTTGAGTYEKSATLNLYADEQAVHQAGWRVWL